MSKSKSKGTRLENLLVDTFIEHGIAAERVPLSGSIGGKYKDDVIIGSIDQPLMRYECKNRENIADYMWDWQEGVDAVVIKKNHKKPLVVITLDQYIELIKPIVSVPKLP